MLAGSKTKKLTAAPMHFAVNNDLELRLRIWLSLTTAYLSPHELADALSLSRLTARVCSRFRIGVQTILRWRDPCPKHYGGLSNCEIQCLPQGISTGRIADQNKNYRKIFFLAFPNN